jgi:hypothetical protein
MSRDENFLSPVTPSGQVLFNGKISQGAFITANNNPSPKYPMPTGQYRDWVGKVRTADVVWKYVDDMECMDECFGNRSTTNAQVSGISALNGQGHAGESGASFLSRIQPLGLAFMPNDDNGSHLFNIHSGGKYTIINLSNKDIKGGDWLMIYAPELREIQEGGRGKEPDRNGLVTLWLVPYHPEIHQNTSAAIYNCLSRMNEGVRGETREGKNYMAEYEDQCIALFDAFLNIGILFVEFLQRQGALTLNADIPANDLYAGILATLGHTHFFNSDKVNPERRQKLLNVLFIDRLPRKSESFAEASYFDASQDEMLYKGQFEAVSSVLVAMARFQHAINNRIMGKAITSMAPKKNGEFQLRSYISK